MDTNSIVDIVTTVAALAALGAPLAVLMERSHRRDRREHGPRTTWTWTPQDSDARRVADEIHALDGAAHR